jgi:nucleotide-binding universal stress UspA family protein
VLDDAEAFSAHIGARLSLRHVVEPIIDWPSLEHERARQDQFRLEARAKIESIQTTAGVVAPLRVAVGDIVTAVAEDTWQEDDDLVVVGRGNESEPHGR